MASPRLCCDDGSLEAAQTVVGTTPRLEKVDTTLGEGACRESIATGGCAQLRRSGVMMDPGEIVEGTQAIIDHSHTKPLIGWAWAEPNSEAKFRVATVACKTSKCKPSAKDREQQPFLTRETGG